MANQKQQFGCGTFLVLVALLMWLGGTFNAQFTEETKPVDPFAPVAQPDVQAKPEPAMADATTPNIDCTIQPERVTFLLNLVNQEVISKCEQSNNVCRLWVKAKFYLLDFDTKQKFVSVAAAWAQCENSKC